MTIFAKIINGEIPTEIVYEDEQCLAFKDISPQAPMHILIVPRKPLSQLTEAGAADEALLGHLMIKAAEVARQQGFEDFRLVVNNGAGAGQTVFHLHIHILAGRPFHWPPG
jgi:histidine triad (HIT) family protein